MSSEITAASAVMTSAGVARLIANARIGLSLSWGAPWLSLFVGAAFLGLRLVQYIRS